MLYNTKINARLNNDIRSGRLKNINGNRFTFPFLFGKTANKAYIKLKISYSVVKTLILLM